MSGKMVGEVLDYAPDDLPRLELTVLLALAESAREDTRRAVYKTTREALADRCRSTPGGIKQALKHLRDRGLIVPVFAQVHRGQAQQYDIVKLTPDHRRMLWS